MYVNIENQVNTIKFSQVGEGELFVYGVNAYIKLKEDRNLPSNINAVDTASGATVIFDPSDEVIIPERYNFEVYI